MQETIKAEHKEVFGVQPESSNMKAMKVLMAMDNRIMLRMMMRNVPEIGFRFTHIPRKRSYDYFSSGARKMERKCELKQPTGTDRSNRAFLLHLYLNIECFFIRFHRKLNVWQRHLACD